VGVQQQIKSYFTALHDTDENRRCTEQLSRQKEKVLITLQKLSAEQSRLFMVQTPLAGLTFIWLLYGPVTKLPCVWVHICQFCSAVCCGSVAAQFYPWLLRNMMATDIQFLISCIYSNYACDWGRCHYKAQFIMSHLLPSRTMFFAARRAAPSSHLSVWK